MGLFGNKFECGMCGTSFKTEAEMKEHGRMHSSQGAPQPTSLRCEACGMTFRSEFEMGEHGRQAHGM
jgi:uncharacterized C2H2 Zn-finger protein